MSMTWQNRSFLLSPPYRTFVLKSAIDESNFVGIQKLIGEVLAQFKQKILRLHLFKRIKRTGSRYPYHPSPKVVQLSIKREPIGLPFFHGGKWQCVSEHSTSQSCVDASQKAHVFLSLRRILRWSVQFRGWEKLRYSNWGPELVKRMILTVFQFNLPNGFHQEVHPQATGDTLPVVHLTGPWVPPMFCASLLNMASSWLMLP